MPAVQPGITLFAQSLVAETITPFDETNAFIGVGNGDTAFSESHTDLQGASKFRKAVDSGFPTRVGNILTYRATFVEAEANFVWKEFGLFNAVSGGTMLFREVENLDTKTSNQVWQLTIAVEVVPGV